jgi:hypothetical protein
MIDILLVNPTQNHYNFLDFFKEKGITYNIVVTAGQLVSYSIDSKFLYNHNTGPPFSDDATFKSAIGCNLAGQRLVERLTQEDRILLSNLKDKATARLENWYNGSEQEGTFLFETVSYKGQHVLNCCLSFKEGKWTLFENQSAQEFVNKVEYAFKALDDMGIRNGPAQIFIDTGDGVSIRTYPVDDMHTQRLIKRHFMDIWNVILQREVEAPDQTLFAYHDWAERFGPTKKFQFA